MIMPPLGLNRHIGPEHPEHKEYMRVAYVFDIMDRLGDQTEQYARSKYKAIEYPECLPADPSLKGKKQPHAFRHRFFLVLFFCLVHRSLIIEQL